MRKYRDTVAVDYLLRKIGNDLVQAAKDDIGNKHGNAGARLGNEVMVEEADMREFE